MGEERTDWRMTASEEETWNRIWESIRIHDQIMSPIPQNLPWPLVEALREKDMRLIYAMALEIDALHRRIDKIEEKMVDTVHPTQEESYEQIGRIEATTAHRKGLR